MIEDMPGRTGVLDPSATNKSLVIFVVPLFGGDAMYPEPDTLPLLRDSPAPNALPQTIWFCPHATPPLLPKRSAAAMRGLTTEISCFFSIPVSVFEV